LVKAKYEFPEASLQELADRVGIAYGTARNLLPKALRKLAIMMDHMDWRRESGFSIEPMTTDDGGL